MSNRESEGTGAWRSILGTLQRRYLDALLIGTEDEAERVVREAIDAGTPEAVIGEEVIAHAMRVVGELWERGAITVADEHLATQISTRVLMLEREAFRAVRRRADATVLLLGIEGEQHILGLQMAASILKHAGYDVVMLGGDVPLAVLPTAIDRHRPAVVGMTATMAATAARLRPAIEAVQADAPRVGVIAGGAGTPASLGSLPGVAVCHHVRDAVELTDGLLHRAGFN
jgi:methanogenic corrinoid protein MtbC1